VDGGRRFGGSIGLSHFRDPISRLDAGPTCSLAIHEPLARTILHHPPSSPSSPSLPPCQPPSLPPDVVAVVDPFLSPVARPGAAGTPPPNGTLELLPNPLSFSALEIRSIL